MVMNVSLRKERDNSRSTRYEEANDCKEQQRREIVIERSSSCKGKRRQRHALSEIRRHETLSFHVRNIFYVAFICSCRVIEGNSPNEGPEIMGGEIHWSRLHGVRYPGAYLGCKPVSSRVDLFHVAKRPHSSHLPPTSPQRSFNLGTLVVHQMKGYCRKLGISHCGLCTNVSVF